MNAEQQKLLEDILANQDFLVDVLKAAKSKNEIPKLEIGDIIDVAGITWRKFKEDEDGNSYMLADGSITTSKFGTSNDWRYSSIREELSYLAEKIQKEIGNKLVPIETDLLSHDGLDDYGTCEDLVSLLTYDLYRHNRKNIKLIDKMWWLATPYSTPSGYSYDYVQYVDDDGDVNYGNCSYVRAVRPFFILKS